MTKALMAAACVLLAAAGAGDAAAQTTPAKFAPARTLPREEQIAIALSAAPKAVADAASVWVQKPSGEYELARTGTNGFGCLIQSERFPRCDDAEGIAAAFPIIFVRAESIAKGQTPEQVNAAVADGYRTGKFRAPKSGSLSYMLSCHPRSVVSPHFMLATPYQTESYLGSTGREVSEKLAKDDGITMLGSGAPDTNVVIYDRARCPAKQ